MRRLSTSTWIVTVLSFAGLMGSTACSSTSAPHVESSASPSRGPTVVELPSGGASATAPRPCTAKQFVACESGAACATRGGVLVEPKTCFDHAKDACSALACTTGCDIHDGTPNQIHCAINASSTGHMRRCGGFAGWGCPEDMRCEVPAGHGFDDDAMGTCVPDGGPGAKATPSSTVSPAAPP